MTHRDRGWFISKGFYYPPNYLHAPLLEEIVWRDGWLRKGVLGAAIRGQVVVVHIAPPDDPVWTRRASRLDAQWMEGMSSGSYKKKLTPNERT